MARRLYVGNLDFGVTERQVRELFSQVGHVLNIVLLKDNRTESGKGVGFVEMKTDEEGRDAIQRFNGYIFNERALKVTQARSPQGRSTNDESRPSHAHSSWNGHSNRNDSNDSGSYGTSNYTGKRKRV